MKLKHDGKTKRNHNMIFLLKVSVALAKRRKGSSTFDLVMFLINSLILISITFVQIFPLLLLHVEENIENINEIGAF